MLKKYKKLNDYVENWLKQYFSEDIINSMSANQKAYHVIYEIKEIKVCPQCHRNLTYFVEGKKMYSKTCSNKCSNMYIDCINERLKNNYSHTNIGKHEEIIINDLFPNNNFKKDKIDAFFPDFIDYETHSLYEINETYHFQKKKLRTDKRKYGYLKSKGWKINVIFDFYERRLTKHFIEKIKEWKKDFDHLVNSILIYANNEDKILTDTGWSKFYGLIRHKDKATNVYEVGDDKIRCTSDHLIFDLNEMEFKKASEFKSMNEPRNEDVYDIINVEKNNRFILNDKTIVHNCLICDEFAMLKPGIEADFLQGVFPVVSSSKTSKIIVVSTPKGMGNEFYRIYTRASLCLEDNTTDEALRWTPVRIDWWDVPGRDEKWRQQQLETLGGDEKRFAQEYGNCVCENTKITLKNKETNEIFNITMR